MPEIITNSDALYACDVVKTICMGLVPVSRALSFSLRVTLLR